MNASELLEAIKANPADFVGRLGSSIRKFLTEEIGSTDKWWGSYREPSKYGSSIWKESGRFDPDDLDTWTKREQENAKKFLNLNKLLTAATKIEDFLFLIDLNGNLVDPPRQISTYEKLSLSPHSGGCMGFLAEFAAALDFLCQLFIPKKSSANFEGFREEYDICNAGSQWLEAIGSIPGSVRHQPTRSS